MASTQSHRRRRRQPGPQVGCCGSSSSATSSSWSAGRARSIVRRTFEGGTQALRSTRCSDPDVIHALKLSVTIALVAVLINLVFGVGMSLLLVRYEFPGKRVLSALIDLPLAVSPIVVGLALILVYNGRYGWFGPTLEDNGLQVIFAMPGHDHGHDLRGAAAGDPRGRARPRGHGRRPGAGRQQPGRQRLADVLADHPARHQVGGRLRRGAEPGPRRWASSARSRSSPATSAARPPRRPVLVQQKYQNFEQQTAYAVSFLLVAVAVLCLIVVALLRPKDHKPSRATATAAIQEKP